METDTTDTTPPPKKRNSYTTGPMGVASHTMTREAYYRRTEGRDSPLGYTGRSLRHR
jgi:hypothetical protein